MILTKIAATLTAGMTLAGAAWVFGDNTGYRPWLKREMQNFTANDFKLVMDQTQQNTLAIAKQEFDLLWGQRKFGALDFEQKITLCKDAQLLRYGVTDESGVPICTKEGEPILTFKPTQKQEVPMNTPMRAQP